MLRASLVIKLAVTTAFGLLPLPATAGIAESCGAVFADQRINIVVPYAAGGGYDIYGRALADSLETVSGTTVAVINMPAGGGLVALNTVATSGPDELIVVVENAGVIVRAQPVEGASPPRDALQLLGVFHSEPSTWLVPSGKNLVDLVGTGATLVGGTSTGDSVTEFQLVAAALGFKVDGVSGYHGSKEMEAALLRGEVDIMPSTLTTSLKAAKAGDVAIGLIFSDAAYPEAPGVPHLAGDGGLAALYAKDATAEQKARTMQLAQLATEMTYTVRSVFAPMAMRPDLRECMSSAVDESIRSPAFKAAVEAQGRPVNVMPLDIAKAFVAAQIAGVATIASILATLNTGN